MSFVVAVMTMEKVIMVGDTQLNDYKGPLSITGTKVLALGNNTLVGIAGHYESYMDIANEINNNPGILLDTFENKVMYVRACIYKPNRSNTAIIAGIEDGVAKFTIMGNEYGYNNPISNVYYDGVVKALLPPGVTTEMCQKYITSIFNLREQVFNCVKEVSNMSDTVNNKAFGFEMSKQGIVMLTNNIRYDDIDIRFDLSKASIKINE